MISDWKVQTLEAHRMEPIPLSQVPRPGCASRRLQPSTSPSPHPPSPRSSELVPGRVLWFYYIWTEPQTSTGSLAPSQM